MNNKKKILMIIILMVIVLLTIAYTYRDKIFFKNKNTNDYTIYKSEITNCEKNKCKDEYDDIDIEYIPSNLEKNKFATLKINSKKVLDDFYELYSLYIYDEDNIIAVTIGTDIRNVKVYIFNEKGKEISYTYELDEKYRDMLIDNKNIVINNEGLFFEGSRLTHGLVIDSLISSSDENTEIYSLSKCDNYNKYIDEVIRGTYKIEYLGNNKFSKVKKIKYQTLIESDIKCE